MAAILEKKSKFIWQLFEDLQSLYLQLKVFTPKYITLHNLINIGIILDTREILQFSTTVLQELFFKKIGKKGSEGSNQNQTKII